ncbi:unnamed protein product [Coccothraustes coccothraustes]
MLHFSLGTNPRMTLPGSMITLCAVGAMAIVGSCLSFGCRCTGKEVSEMWSDSSLLSIIAEARQLVDATYLQA